METSYPLNTIYGYTLDLVKSQEDTLTRLDTKISTFIGFSGVLIRLALDLPGETPVGRAIKLGVCAFSVLAILLSAIGLVAKQTGKVADPELLMSDKWFYGYTEDEHKAYIVNSWIVVMDEYDAIAKRKATRLFWIVACFTLASVLFGVGVGLEG